MAFFCRGCLKTTCSKCLEKIHNHHDVVPLEYHQDGLTKRLLESKSDINETRRLSGELRVNSKPRPMPSNLLDCINRTKIASDQALSAEHRELLQQGEKIEFAHKGGIWHKLDSQLDTYSSLICKEDAAEKYYDNTTVYEKAIENVTIYKDAVSDGGVLTCIENLEVKFVPTPEISLGHIEERTGWRLVKKIDLPEDKASQMNACMALSGRRVAVGYCNGGVDIIRIDDEQRVRILDDKAIYCLTVIGNDALAVCTVTGNLFTCNISSATNGTPSFITKQSIKCKCLCTDNHYNIYIGYSELKTIEVFDQSGGSPIRTIKTELDPLCISVIKTGHIAVTDCVQDIKDAVHVIKQDGTVVCRIPGCDDHAPYSTCDQQDNIYLAMKHKTGKININKYSANGEYLETVTVGFQTTVKPRMWMHISCVSPTELVVCDINSIYVFQRRPSLTQLMKLEM